MGQLMKVKVIHKMSDHNAVHFDIDCSIQMTTKPKRSCWVWKQAKWNQLRMHLENTDWAQVFGGNDVDYVSEHFTDYVLKLAKKFIPIREYAFPKSSHPWLNEKCLELVLNKHNAEGKEDYEFQRDLCSKGLSTEFKCHAERMKAKVSGLPVSLKKWWKLCNTLGIGKPCASRSALAENQLKNSNDPQNGVIIIIN